MLARSLALLVTLLLPAGALATTVHGSFSTANFDFTSVQETTQTPGDPEPLFGAPTAIVPTDALIFFPSSFSATSAGGGADSTLSLLQMMISTTSGAPINTINISEFGDTTLSGSGSAVTRTEVAISGFVTVLEVSDGNVTIPAPIALLLAGPINFNFNPTPADPYTLPANPGTTIWTALDLEIDVASHVASVLGAGWYATEVQFSLNNQLDAFSEGSSSATIQKKGQLIISVPEPGSLVVLGTGFLLVLVHGRRRARAA